MQRWLALVLLLGASAIPAQEPPAAQSPSIVPLALLVPYAPGGSVDAAARAIAAGLSVELRRPVVVHNRPGGSGAIGMALLARSPPDGRVVGMGTVSTLAVLPATRGKLGYAPVHSFAPVGLVASAPAAVLVSGTLGVTTLEELTTLARARPAELNFGSVGEGSILHLAGQMFMATARVDMTHVPYPSMARLLPDLMSGRIHVLIDQLGSVPPGFIESGALRVVAVLAPRTSTQPARPASNAEAGLPGLNLRMWSGLLAPAGTPATVVEELNAALDAALRRPELRAAFANLGMQAEGGSAQDFAELIRREQFTWRAAAEAAHWEMLAPSAQEQRSLDAAPPTGAIR